MRLMQTITGKTNESPETTTMEEQNREKKESASDKENTHQII